MKKIISTLLGAVMMTASFASLAACGDKTPDNQGGDNDAKYKYTITVWTGEDTKKITEDLIDDFNKTNTSSIHFTATVNEVTESRAAGDIINKTSAAPEIYCFAQDQIARLVDVKGLAMPGKSAVDKIKDVNSEDSVKAATVGSTVYAYPLSEDNGYFLYYDKSQITAEEAKTVEGIISACETKNKYFSFNLDGEGAGWYVSSFFYGAGAKSEWTTSDQGKFTAYQDDFNSDKGKIAMQGLNKVLKSSRYIKGGKASDFNAATPAAAVVSGVWDYSTAKNALGDNLGIAPLPTYTVGDKDYQLVSSMGCKLMGVSPQTDGTKAGALSLLAQHLTSSDAQLKRYTALGWGPSAKAAQENDSVKNDPALAALKTTATIAQGQYPAEWWTKVLTLAATAKTAETLTAMETALATYAEGLNGLLSN